MRRCQILLASSRRERVSRIARNLSCATPSVRNAIRDFHRRGFASLEEQSRRPKTVPPMLDERKSEDLRALLHTSPRPFGKPTSLWTLELVAEVLWERGRVSERLSREAIRKAIQRLGVKWKRAKRWISSPDPQYTVKKNSSTG
jgi:transposase